MASFGSSDEEQSKSVSHMGDGGVGGVDGGVGGVDIGALPSRGWWQASLSATENPFMIGSPKFIEWRTARQVSFQERVIGMGLAHTALQSKASRATMVRRAAQLRGRESAAAGGNAAGFGGARSYEPARSLSQAKRRTFPAEV